MLITTYAGLMVNSDHIAYIALKRCETAAGNEPRPDASTTGTLHKLLLCLSGDVCLVAATELSLATAQRLRQEIAQKWTEGAKTFDVTDALRRLCERSTKGEN